MGLWEDGDAYLRLNASAPMMKVRRRSLAVSLPQIEESLMEAISTRFKRHGSGRGIPSVNVIAR